MKFPSKLHQGRLIKRYKRFFADVELDDGQVVTAHCPNTGSMKTCGAPGDVVLLSKTDNPKRKLAFTWELTKLQEGYVGVNTSLPNRIVQEALTEKQIMEFAKYSEIKPEVKYGENSRIDFLLRDPKRKDCYIEVKNTTLIHEGMVMFPDAVTTRGLKHLHELSKIALSGSRAAMLFLVNRPDGRCFRPAVHIDPEYSEGLRSAKNNGVELFAFRTSANLEEIRLGDPLTIEL